MARSTAPARSPRSSSSTSADASMIRNGAADLLVTLTAPLVNQLDDPLARDAPHGLTPPEALKPLLARGQRKIDFDQPPHVLAQTPALLTRPVPQLRVYVLRYVLDLDGAHSMIIAFIYHARRASIHLSCSPRGLVGARAQYKIFATRLGSRSGGCAVAMRWSRSR